MKKWMLELLNWVYDITKAWVLMFAFVVTNLATFWFLHGAVHGAIDILFPTYYGEVLITSQVDGLSIIIDEKKVGKTRTDAPFRYRFKNPGQVTEGRHGVVFQKDIDPEREYYLEKWVSISDEQIEKKEAVKISVFAADYDVMKNGDFDHASDRVTLRTKRDVLRKRTGLVKEVKLKHGDTYSMAMDDNRLYVISRDYSEFSEETGNENAEYLEIVDLETLRFKDDIKLNQRDSSLSYEGIAANDNYIYISARSSYTDVMYSTKKEMFGKKYRDYLITKDLRERITAIRLYNDYVFALDERGNVAVYKNHTFLYTLHTRALFKGKNDTLKDKRFGAVYDLVVHNGVIYISNSIEMVFMYKLNDEKPELLGRIERTHYNENTKEYYAVNIRAMRVYQDRFLLYSTEYMGLSCYDTQTGNMVYEYKNLHPASSVYSDALKKEIDDTKRTDIHTMVLYNHYLIFSEGADLIEVYDLDKNKIVHTYEGANGRILALDTHKDQLISLSGEGVVYIWDLKVLERVIDVP